MRTLLMGGQACVFYGAAEFSRDVDLLIVADPENLKALSAALATMMADNIAVPPFSEEYLSRGHAVHFRCRGEGLNGLRIDVMSKLRGVAPFPELWSRRTVIRSGDLEVDLLSLPDLVAAKKTQRDKDWPMIRRLAEQAYFQLSAEPEAQDIAFLLRELRTPELLQELAERYPDQARELFPTRPALMHAVNGETELLAKALTLEEAAERDADRAYWQPLKRELEWLRLRVARDNRT